MLASKRILLVIGGGIAAYKSLEIIRRLREKSAEVIPVLTRAGAKFVTPLSVSALAGNQVHQDLFDLTMEAEMGHIALSRNVDLILVAPTTANLMARMATGQADDLATTLLLATDTKIMLAPAMNVRMWENPATRRNFATLKNDGISFIGPNDGDMACGEFGPGRMAEPEEIVAAIDNMFSEGLLTGKRALVTSGPTHEPIDPVRYIANRSSGTQGNAIASALKALGADVILITGPVETVTPEGVKVIRAQTAREMMNAVRSALPADVAVFAAAVADWRVKDVSGNKIKKNGKGLPKFEFEENPDILATVAKMKSHRPQLVIGFAAETNDVVENAASKRLRKGCDWIVANDVSHKTGIMGGTENAVTLVTEKGSDTWERMSKNQVANRLADLVARELS